MKNRKSFLILGTIFLVAGFVYFLFYDVNEGKTYDIYKPATNNLDSRFDHAPNYSWVSGQLHYNPLEGGCWSLKFSNKQENEDNYWGIFGLEFGNPQIVNKLKDGSFITIKGKIKGKEFSMSCPQYIYTVIGIEDEKSLPETPPIGEKPPSIFYQMRLFMVRIKGSVLNFLRGVKSTETKTKNKY